MSLRSMTGFARVRETVGETEIVISIKSVNHRGLDLHFSTGAELDRFENALRAAVKRRIARGHIDVRIQLARAGVTSSLSFDRDRLEAYVRAFRTASEQYGLSGPLDLNEAFRGYGILTESSDLNVTEDFEPALVALLEQALDLLNGFREREGGEIGSLLLDRAAAIQRAASEIESIRADVSPAAQARLRERLADLLSGSGIEPQRIVQEAAILADRSDIGEEIERLRIHSGQLRSLLQTGDEIGKKLDFLLQEMNRETNTILSKTSGLGDHGLRITELGVGVKSDIEKMREQSLNLE